MVFRKERRFRLENKVFAGGRMQVQDNKVQSVTLMGLLSCSKEVLREDDKGRGGWDVGKGIQVRAAIRLWQNLAWWIVLRNWVCLPNLQQARH